MAQKVCSNFDCKNKSKLDLGLKIKFAVAKNKATLGEKYEP